MSVSLAIEVVPTGSVGAEVRGVDIAAARPAEIEAVKRAWYAHDVLVFRDQKLSDDDLLAFSRHFGALDPPPNQGAGKKSPPGYPDIYEVSNDLDAKGEPIGALGDGLAHRHELHRAAARRLDALLARDPQVRRRHLVLRHENGAR
jgi:taurine dioxygenase